MPLMRSNLKEYFSREEGVYSMYIVKILEMSPRLKQINENLKNDKSGGIPNDSHMMDASRLREDFDQLTTS